MIIENAHMSPNISAALALASEIALSKNIDVKVMTQSDESKGEIISAIIFGIAGNAAYDLVKLAVKRIIAAKPISKDDLMTIDGTPKTLEEISKEE